MLTSTKFWTNASHKSFLDTYTDPVIAILRRNGLLRVEPQSDV